MDDAGRFDEAFAAYEQANRLYLESRHALGERFDAVALHHQIEDTIGTFTPTNFRILADWGNPSKLPVFIVGSARERAWSSRSPQAIRRFSVRESSGTSAN